MEKLEKQLTEVFYPALVRGVTGISPDILALMQKGLQKEEWPAARGMIGRLIENVTLAREQKKGGLPVPRHPLRVHTM